MILFCRSCSSTDFPDARACGPIPPGIEFALIQVSTSGTTMWAWKSITKGLACRRATDFTARCNLLRAVLFSAIVLFPALCAWMLEKLATG